MSVKISQLTASAALTSDDFFPVVDSGSLTTLRASAQQVLNFITGSTFNTLSASNVQVYEQRVDNLLNTNFLRVSGTSISSDLYQDTSTRFTFDTNAQHFQFFKLATPITASFGNASTGLTEIKGTIVKIGNSSSPTNVLGNLIISGSSVFSGSIFVSGSSIYGQVAELTSSTSNYTLLPQDSGKFVNINSGSAVNLTVPAGLPTGFTVSVCQLGSGSVSFITGSGVVINNRQSHTKTAGQFAVASIVGTAANVYVLVGDTTT